MAIHAELSNAFSSALLQVVTRLKSLRKIVSQTYSLVAGTKLQLLYLFKP